jgi:glucose/arabinose dehydrogenase
MQIFVIFMTIFVTASAIFAAESPKMALEPFVKGVEFPLYVTHDGTKRLFIVGQRGKIWLVEDGKLQSKPYLDITDGVHFGGECGLLGLAFHPKFAENGRFFVNYTGIHGKQINTRIAEFQADRKATQVPAVTKQIVIGFDQPWANHNGGQILFGPDGKLYIGTGDGGSAGDPLNSGQRLNTLLGKILRIDVDETSRHGVYAIPPDNPFVDRAGARPEIWTYGFRNPWRFSFDRETGLMYCADVGQDKREEINIIARGKNYGWNIMEGNLPFKNGRSKRDLVAPIKDYGRDFGGSVTGGYVYRGKKIPSLAGYYIYGDYLSGRIWALKYENGRMTEDFELLRTGIHISSFGEDVDGELYVCDHLGGEVLRITSAAEKF